MPKLVIDDREIEVPKGTKVIDAAERLGIMIPRFCYHEALGSVGACRMCAVKFLQGPFKGVQMSCMIDAQDGMVVSTTDAEAVQFRKWVIELLMMNHPHDCPVCDEGGQCLLQDETVSGGHGTRKYLGKKRTYRDQYLGPYIQHEMNRCIHCYRCSRFYQEYAGYRDLGPMQIGDRVYFGRFEDGALQSPFSGNLVDVCPTGVYTDKTARFKVRRWDLQRAPSLCINCSLGCNTIGNAHYRAVMRVEARYNKDVNGYFICDACRFGFTYTNGGSNHDKRPSIPRIACDEATAAAALTKARTTLAEVAEKHGSQAIAVLGSHRNSLETQCMMKRLCRTNNWSEPAFFLDSAMREKVRSAVARLDKRVAISMREIEQADFIMVAGADPLNEAGMAALAIRQASRKGASVVVIDPRPISMPLDFDHIPASPDEIEKYLGLLIRNGIEGDAANHDQQAKVFRNALTSEGVTDQVQARLKNIAEKLKASKKPVIICGTSVVRETTPAFAADCVLLLRQTDKDAGIFYLLPGASSFSAALLDGGNGLSLFCILEGIERGSIRALIAVESDLFRHFPDRNRLEQTIAKLDVLIAIDYLPTDLIKRASVFYPSSTVFETDSTYVNQEGRAQFAHRVHAGGTPIWGGHPPHVFRDYLPGGDHMPAWEVLWAIGSKTEGTPSESEAVVPAPGEFIFLEHPLFEGMDSSKYPVDGVRIIPEESEEKSFVPVSTHLSAKGPDTLELLLVDWMFGTGEFSAHSDSLAGSITPPVLTMHAADAKRTGLADGDVVYIELDSGAIEIKLSVSDRMAEGVLILPRHQWLDWQKVKDYRFRLPLDKIRKVQ